MRHFWSLSRERDQGFNGPQAIKTTEVEAYYRVYRLDEFISLIQFAQWISELDKAFVKFYMDKLERERKRK